MNLATVKLVYFLGVGGIGMSAIARYFHLRSVKVMGYDKTQTPLTLELSKEGIEIHYSDLGSELESLQLMPESTLVIYTPAIPKDHQELLWFQQHTFTLLKRSQVLGWITDAYRTIGVAGTHGKTTTSTLIAHLLKQSTTGCAAFLGGISTNYQTNLLTGNAHLDPSKQYMVVEADEFDRSFLTLHPSIGIITSTDADHLDIYGEHSALLDSFAAYASQVRDLLIIKQELELSKILRSLKNASHRILTYSLHENADAHAENIRISKDQYFFDLHYAKKIIANLYLGIPGLHNVENAIAASVAALEAGINEEELRTGLATFKGVKRRFEYIIQQQNRIFIDDYAHHPEELNAILSSVKQMYPERKITAIFQPHLYSRTRDFAEGFSKSLSLVDDIVLLDIYPARELPIPGVSSAMLLTQISAPEKALCAREDVLSVIAQKNPEVLITVGAGDIDQLVEPLRQLLNSLTPRPYNGIR